MTALLSMGFVACTENFDPEVGPQTNLQESLLQASDVTVTNQVPDVINLLDYIDAETSAETPIPIGVAAVKEGAMPANTILKAEVEVSRNADFAESAVIEANAISDNNEISIQPGALEDAYFEEITKNPSTTQLYVRTIMYTVTGGDAVAIVGKPGENFYAEKTVTFTPLNKLTIAPAYYIVGGPNDWNDAPKKQIKFEHSGEDVYVDPVFTVVFDAAPSGDTWFAIGDDAACEAIPNDWSLLYGIVSGDNEEKEGKLARRNEMGGAENSFKVAAGAKKIRVTINMMEQTFKVETVNIADAYYLVGGPGSWSSDKSQKFSHSDKSAFEDPIFTYTFEGNGGGSDGGGMWFAFGDAEALDAIDANKWDQLYGTTGASEDLSGSFDRRYNLGGEHSFHVDGLAKFYRFTINMLDMTYTITPLNFSEYIWEAGVNNGWGGYEQPLYCADGNGTYTGFFYAQEDSWTDGKGAFKFRGAADNWDNGNYGTGTLNADGLTGSLIDDGGSGNIMPAPGFYRADVNLATMTFTLTPINSVYVVGSAVNNDWDNGVKMTFNTTEHCWECDATFTEAGVIKFKGNGTWDNIDGNWGGTMDNIINGSNDNIPVSVSGNVHIKFYPRCDTKSYCEITKK